MVHLAYAPPLHPLGTAEGGQEVEALWRALREVSQMEQWGGCGTLEGHTSCQDT